MRFIPYIVLFLMFLGFSTDYVTADHEDTGVSDLELDENNQYRVELIASNFDYRIIDLVEVERLGSDGMNLTQARYQAEFEDEINNLDYGRFINISAKSEEGIHGIFISEINIDLYLDPPEGNDTYGPEVTSSSILPTVDTTMRLYCNVFCGEGHSTMELTIRVGEGRDFSDGSIEIFSNWRVWLMFGTFFVVTIVIVALGVMKPRFFFSWDEDQ